MSSGSLFPPGDDDHKAVGNQNAEIEQHGGGEKGLHVCSFGIAHVSDNVHRQCPSHVGTPMAG